MTNFTPIDAFICGHDISYVGTYFDQVLLTDRLSFSGNEKGRAHAKKMIERLKGVGKHFSFRLKRVQKYAEFMQLPPFSLPELPPQYSNWVPDIHRKFVQKWSVQHLEGWLFTMGFCVGELRNASIILLLCYDFQVNFAIGFDNEIAKIKDRLQGVTKHWALSATRLEGHQLGRPFTQKYQRLSPMVNAIVQGMSKPEITVAHLVAVIQSLLAELAEVERLAIEIKEA